MLSMKGRYTVLDFSKKIKIVKYCETFESALEFCIPKIQRYPYWNFYMIWDNQTRKPILDVRDRLVNLKKIK